MQQSMYYCLIIVAALVGVRPGTAVHRGSASPFSAWSNVWEHLIKKERTTPKMHDWNGGVVVKNCSCKYHDTAYNINQAANPHACWRRCDMESVCLMAVYHQVSPATCSRYAHGHYVMRSKKEKRTCQCYMPKRTKINGLVRAFDPPSQVTTKHGQKEASLDTAENAFSECVTGKKCAAPAPGKRFCVGCEGSLVYCYGSDYGCLWGRLDCSSDADCAKYSSSSPKYTQGAAHQCPYTDGWGREACVHHVAPTPDPPTPFPSPLPTTTAIPTTFLPSLPPTAPVPPTSVPSLSPTTGCVTWRKCAHLAQDETFCVGCEDALIYCYGSPDGCLWGRQDCSSDADCTKYSSSSPKYTEGAAQQCPYATGWQQKACVHHVAPTRSPTTHLPSLSPTTGPPTTQTPSWTPIPPSACPVCALFDRYRSTTPPSYRSAIAPAYSGPGPCYGPDSWLTIITGLDSVTSRIRSRVYDALLKNKVRYAQQFGYRICFFSKADTFGYQITWMRINELLEYMASSRWLMWMDADAIFNRFDIPVSRFIHYAQQTQYPQPNAAFSKADIGKTVEIKNVTLWVDGIARSVEWGNVLRRGHILPKVPKCTLGRHPNCKGKIMSVEPATGNVVEACKAKVACVANRGPAEKQCKYAHQEHQEMTTCIGAGTAKGTCKAKAIKKCLEKGKFKGTVSIGEHGWHAEFHNPSLGSCVIPDNFPFAPTSAGCAHLNLQPARTASSRREARKNVHLILPDECVNNPAGNNLVEMPNIAVNLNDGIFFIDNSSFSEQFLREIVKYKQWKTAVYWEQSAMKTWRQQNTLSFREHARVVSHALINECFQPCPMPTDYSKNLNSKRFIIHWAGCSGEKWKIKRMGSDKFSIWQYLTRNKLV